MHKERPLVKPNVNQSLKVVIADDHASVRRGLSAFFHEDPGLQVVGEAGDGMHALMLIEQYKPDVLVLDIRMPDVNGIKLLEMLRERQLHVAVLVISAVDDDALINRALALGAAGFASKTAEPEQLVAAVYAVAAGETVVLREATHGVAAIRRCPLSARERDVLFGISRGLTNKAIAHNLTISDRTVQGHIAGIFAKLGTHSRTESVLLAIREGWIENA